MSEESSPNHDSAATTRAKAIEVGSPKYEYGNCGLPPWQKGLYAGASPLMWSQTRCAQVSNDTASVGVLSAAADPLQRSRFYWRRSTVRVSHIFFRSKFYFPKNQTSKPALSWSNFRTLRAISTSV
ncbi:hypothetical protein RND71_018520 [Anisodus tanguticus]|uniref:Uncharacterized protein n=1 Tax=Anisodus tanguticus TaxID=243964 RepID=A0AAE1VJF5_9SOLA|nr:hypothetical protein RND71_018520 [Anisodus tanguticus]